MAAADRVEGVHTVEDVDLVTAAEQGARESVDIGGVAAEAMTPEERGDHAKFHGRPDLLSPDCQRILKTIGLILGPHSNDMRVEGVPRFGQPGKVRTEG